MARAYQPFEERSGILFSVNDIPIVEAFNLYREEPENSLHTTQAPQIPTAGGK
jgi:hypothetical protein